MSQRIAICATLAALLLGACEKQRPAPPVVRVQPVETRPFEDGNAAGYERGKADATPGAEVPSESQAEALAATAAAEQSEGNDKWRRGWAEGYLAGFRSVATGAK